GGRCGPGWGGRGGEGGGGRRVGGGGQRQVVRLRDASSNSMIGSAVCSAPHPNPLPAKSGEREQSELVVSSSLTPLAWRSLAPPPSAAGPKTSSLPPRPGRP